MTRLIGNLKRQGPRIHCGHTKRPRNSSQGTVYTLSADNLYPPSELHSIRIPRRTDSDIMRVFRHVNQMTRQRDNALCHR